MKLQWNTLTPNLQISSLIIIFMHKNLGSIVMKNDTCIRICFKYVKFKIFGNCDMNLLHKDIEISIWFHVLRIREIFLWNCYHRFQILLLLRVDQKRNEIEEGNESYRDLSRQGTREMQISKLRNLMLNTFSLSLGLLHRFWESFIHRCDMYAVQESKLIIN